MTPPSAAILPSELLSAQPLLERTVGAARIAFKNSDGATRLDRLYQSGAAKVRFPYRLADEPPEAVLINTAGGLTGGDSFSTEIHLDAGCRAVATTQACERIYRAISGTAEVQTTISIGERARLDWLPQETILFDGGRISRRLDAELAADAELLAVEAAVFGRTARGESVRSGLFSDRWRIRRGGRPVFADDLRLDWSVADLLERPAVLAGASAMATVLLVTGEPERHLETARRIVGKAGGVSAWEGKLLARVVAESGFALRRTLIPLLVALRDGAPLPKLWRI
jgi:urease accessory protein